MLRNAVPILVSANVDGKLLAKYLRNRRIITGVLLKEILGSEDSQGMHILFDCLNRKADRAWPAVKDWLIKNVPEKLYKKVTGKQMSPEKSEFTIKIEQSLNANPDEPATPDISELLTGTHPLEEPHATDIGELLAGAHPLTLVNPTDVKFGEGSTTLLEAPSASMETKGVLEDTMMDSWEHSEAVRMLIENQSQPTDAMNSTNDPISEEIDLYELWGEIMKDNMSMGDVTNNKSRCKLNVGKNVFVTAGFWQGEIKIHIRRFDPSNSFPTDKGLVFSIDLWKRLAKMVDEIDYRYANIQKMIGRDVQIEVGERIFVGMEIGMPKIDIRLWWYPPGHRILKRTTKGVRLNFWQWYKLKAILKYLPVFVPELDLN
jgi:hypothetical protein